MYYPQLVAGPIERPQNLLHQFRRVNNFRFQNFYRGLRLIIVGFFMKLVVADRLAIYVDSVYNNADKHVGPTLILATFFFAFQIYCDFAGYSSIAIGVSRIMGIKLMTNFRRPYLSKTVSEFWRRWHISLSTWFKDYVFISMGGSRVESKIRIYFNLMVTFLISGFWHGASWTFVIWGGLNGVYLIFEQMFDRVHRFLASHSVFAVLKVIYVFALISLAWIFFRSNSTGDALMITRKIFTTGGQIFAPADPEILIYCFLAVFFIISSEIFYETVYERRKIKRYAWLNNTYMIFLIIAILLLGVFDGGQFIYFQF